MKRSTWTGVLLLLVIVVGFWRYQRQQRIQVAPATTDERAQPAGGSSPELVRAAPRDGGHGPIAEVRRLPAAERDALKDSILAGLRRARAAETAQAEGAAPAPVAADAYPVLRLEDAGPKLREALEQAIPHLAECYPKGSRARTVAVAQMTLFTDPETGTVIDTDAIVGRDGGVVDGKVDACLRDTIDSLALPPLGRPGRLQLEYSFRFE
jgi:hypothetical protein